MAARQRRDWIEFSVYSAAWSSAAALEAARARCVAHGRELTRDHVWNFGGWSVGAEAAVAAQRRPARLHGRVAVGDCVGDEWLVARIICSFTRLCARSAATLRDVDGEFLLIEAALHLPDWVDPSTSHNRVWIVDGALHLIEPSVAPGVALALDTALASIGPRTRSAGVPLDAAVAQRIVAADAWSGSNVHRARCVLPLSVAALLRSAGGDGDVGFGEGTATSAPPASLAAAIEVFFNRTPRDVRAAARLAYLGVDESSPTIGTVVCLVTMSRMMFAKLKQQRFGAPRAYTAACAPPTPPLPPTASDAAQRKRAAAAELGTKLACAVVMAAARSARAEEAAGETVDDDGLLVACGHIAERLRALQRSSGDGSAAAAAAAESDDDTWLDVGAAELDALLSERGLSAAELLAETDDGESFGGGSVVLDDEVGRGGGARFGGALGADSDDDLPPPSSPRAAASGAAPAPAIAGTAVTSAVSLCYVYTLCESCSQFDSPLPLTSLTGCPVRANGRTACIHGS